MMLKKEMKLYESLLYLNMEFDEYSPQRGKILHLYGLCFFQFFEIFINGSERGFLITTVFYAIVFYLTYQGIGVLQQYIETLEKCFKRRKTQELFCFLYFRS